MKNKLAFFFLFRQNLRKEINMREQNLDTELMQRLSIINGEKASNEEIDESDDMNRQNDIDFLLDESLPPEQYRETAIDKNFKMKQQLEVNLKLETCF